MTANNITATCILNPKFAREFGLPKGSTKKFKNINPSEVSKLTNDTIDYLNSRNPVPVKKPEPVKLHPDQKILNTKLNLERERLKESMTKVIKKRLTVSQERRI
jgi:protein tyrosine/serine phosphatase